MTAYRGDPALKRGLLEQLERRFDEGRLRFCQEVWDGRSGSVLGCIMSADDAPGLAVRYGIPDALCHLLDPLASEVSASGRAAGSFVLDWMEAMPVGAALDTVPFDLMVWMLEHAGPPTALTSALAARHRADRDAAGVDPSASAPAWRALQRGAVAAADAPGADAGARFEEAAAAPLQRSPSTLSVAFQDWVGLPSEAASGWSGADQERVDALLRSREPGDDLLPMERLQAADHPLAVRLRAHLDQQARMRHRRANQAADALLALLRGTGPLARAG